MGNHCSSEKARKYTDSDDEDQSLPVIPEEFVRTGLHFLPLAERNDQMDEFLKQIQKHNLEIMKEEFKNDLHGFILNNLLLCVQFVDNFDKSMASAKLFKFDTEKRLNEKLATIATDGAILGERKCVLIHGMGHQLTKTYIYRDKNADESGGRNDNEYGGSAITNMSKISRGLEEIRNTFMCESILPLEFVITWDNLEVYKESEWQHLKDYQYSSAKGTAGINRFCMEEPDEKNKISKGYVRLRCVDTPLALRPKHPTPAIETSNASADYEYSNASDFVDHDKTEVDEVRTESDYSSTIFSDSDDFLDDFSSGAALIYTMQNRLKFGKMGSPPPTSPVRDNFGPRSRNVNFPKSTPVPVSPTHGKGRRLSGELPRSYPVTSRQQDAPIMPPPGIPEASSGSPTYSVATQKTDGSTTSGNTAYTVGKEITGTEDIDLIRIPRVTLTHTSSFGSKSDKTLDDGEGSVIGKLPNFRAKRSVQRANQDGPAQPGYLTPPPINTRRRLRPIQPPRPLSTPNGDLNNNTQVRQSPSSGYDTASPNFVRSRSSSVGSNEIRQRWRQAEVKKLWQFPTKRRPKATEPISEGCFRQIEYPVESDSDEEVPESSSSDTNSDPDSDSDESGAGKKKAPSEVRFEQRTYLDPLSYSSDFCSEFKQIGNQIGISGSSLGTAIVLGTTIRCAVEYPPGLNDPDSEDLKQPETFNVLCTFTPSLNSKAWPQKPLIWWKRRMRKAAWDGTEKWPHEAQVEMIEQLGCNAIPLGYRSIHLTQAENLLTQTLEWHVGFAQAENILLNSLNSVHWKCLTMSSLLFRAFIAPLGPLGIGLEHFRNILYFMCNKEFALWNEEQPGLHLKTLLFKVYECLSRGDMSSFFIREHNMLKNIPPANVKKVQAYLSRVLDNPVIYAMYAFRNLKRIGENHYPMPNLRKLYKYLTNRNEQDILFAYNPILAGPSTMDDDKKKKKKKRKKYMEEALLRDGENIDAEYAAQMRPQTFRKVDKTQKRARKKFHDWEERQKELKAQEELKAEELRVKNQFPQDRRSSIDLSETPVKPLKCSQVRTALILRFFIRHFIKMCRKSVEFEDYAQAAMYVQHLENLTYLLSTIPMEAGSQELDNFETAAKDLRHLIGPTRMHEYIRAKMSHRDTHLITQDDITGITTISKAFSNSPNWDLRKLPTPPNSALRPPSSVADPQRSPGGVRRLQLAGSSSSMAKTLQSIPTTVNTNIDQDHEPSTPRRTPSIKFIDRPTSISQTRNSNSSPSNSSTPFQ